MPDKTIPEKQEIITALLLESEDAITYAGTSFNGKKLSEMTFVQKTFLSILERVGRNTDALILMIKSNYIEENRQPIMVILRSIISDLLVGIYLLQFKDKPKSFENEVNVLNSDFAKFAFFLYEEEPKYPFVFNQKQFESLADLKSFIQNKKGEFAQRFPALFKQEGGGFVFKSVAELRTDSEDSFFQFQDDTGQFKLDKKKGIGEKYIFDRLEQFSLQSGIDIKPITYAYLTYRALSQYCHFSMGGVDIMNREKNAETDWIYRAVGQCFTLLIFVFDGVDLDKERLEKLLKTFEMHWNNIHANT